MRACIDGSIFYKLENDVNAKRAAAGEAKQGKSEQPAKKAQGADAPSEAASSSLLDGG